jgi:hypothetical protein
LRGGTNLTSAYWNAWYDTVKQYAAGGGHSFFPGIYMNPNDSGTCSVVKTSPHIAHGIWSNQPQDPSGSCPSTTPAWNPTGCGSTPNKVLWQHATENTQNPKYPNGCSHWCNDGTYAVDFDGFNPNMDTELNYTIHIPLA